MGFVRRLLRSLASICGSAWLLFPADTYRCTKSSPGASELVLDEEVFSEDAGVDRVAFLAGRPSQLDLDQRVALAQERDEHEAMRFLYRPGRVGSGHKIYDDDDEGRRTELESCIGIINAGSMRPRKQNLLQREPPAWSSGPSQQIGAFLRDSSSAVCASTMMRGRFLHEASPPDLFHHSSRFIGGLLSKNVIDKFLDDFSRLSLASCGLDGSLEHDMRKQISEVRGMFASMEMSFGQQWLTPENVAHEIDRVETLAYNEGLDIFFRGAATNFSFPFKVLYELRPAGGRSRSRFLSWRGGGRRVWNPDVDVDLTDDEQMQRRLDCYVAQRLLAAWDLPQDPNRAPNVQDGAVGSSKSAETAASSSWFLAHSHGMATLMDSFLPRALFGILPAGPDEHPLTARRRGNRIDTLLGETIGVEEASSIINSAAARAQMQVPAAAAGQRSTLVGPLFSRAIPSSRTSTSSLVLEVIQGPTAGAASSNPDTDTTELLYQEGPPEHDRGFRAAARCFPDVHDAFGTRIQSATDAELLQATQKKIAELGALWRLAGIAADYHYTAEMPLDSTFEEEGEGEQRLLLSLPQKTNTVRLQLKFKATDPSEEVADPDHLATEVNTLDLERVRRGGDLERGVVNFYTSRERVREYVTRQRSLAKKWRLSLGFVLETYCDKNVEEVKMRTSWMKRTSFVQREAGPPDEDEGEGKRNPMRCVPGARVKEVEAQLKSLADHERNVKGSGHVRIVFHHKLDD